MQSYNSNVAYDLERFEQKKKLELKKVTKPVQEERKAYFGTLAVIRAVVLAIIVCTIMGLVINNRVTQTELTANINSVKKEISELQTENTRLSVKLESLMSIKNIDDKATLLGLEKIDQSQISYISVNNFDKIEIQKKDDGFIAVLFGKLKEIFG